MAIKVKRGVSLIGIRPQCRPILKESERIWAKNGQVVCVTEALGGIHSAGSCHYYGFALDLRIRYFNEIEKGVVFLALKNTLKANSPYYDVILHKSHIHAEFDIFRYMADHDTMVF